MSTIKLCHQNDLAEMDTRSFTIEQYGREKDIFLVKVEGHIKAYLNNCPHLGIPLNWKPDEFLSMEGTHIQCSTHGALFTLETGACIAGPCRGQALTPIGIEIDAVGDVLIHD